MEAKEEEEEEEKGTRTLNSHFLSSLMGALGVEYFAPVKRQSTAWTKLQVEKVSGAITEPWVRTCS